MGFVKTHGGLPHDLAHSWVAVHIENLSLGKDDTGEGDKGNEN